MNSEHCLLVIQEQPDQVAALRSILYQSGYTIYLATNGLEGWHYALTTPVNMILLDIPLPTLDGFQILARLKHNPATETIPVIMITDSTWIGEWPIAFKLGAVLCLCKDDCLGSLAREKFFCDVIYHIVRTHKATALSYPSVFTTSNTQVFSTGLISGRPGSMARASVLPRESENPTTTVQCMLEQEVGRA